MTCDRRTFLKTSFGLTGAFALPAQSLDCRKKKKPNILFIMVDDLGKEWISCYGGENIQTPNIDALAATGMKFNNAYSMPQCTPSRVTLLTGKYPWRNGWVNHWDVPRWGVGYFDWKQRENVTFARILKKAGYVTASAGKWQINDFRIEPQAMKNHGFDDWCMWTGYETHNPPSGNRYWDPYINTPGGSKTYQNKYGPDIYADFLIEFMNEHRNQPMMLYFPMALTHAPFHPTPDDPHAEETQHRFKAMVEYTDKLMGRLTKALDKIGIRKNTIVIFTTDNGSPRNITNKRNGVEISGGKGKKTETGTCAPFIVSCPGIVPSGMITDELTDFTDMLPTFAELAGTKIPEDIIIDGKSIAPLLLGKTKKLSRDWIMALGHGPAKLDEKGVRGQVDYASRVIRDKRYKVWINENRKIIRLHDLQNDPLEKKNLLASSQPDHINAVNKFKSIINSLPKKDARPKYKSRQAFPWDRKMKKG